jgi:amino-acid N-acetyltransferase
LLAQCELPASDLSPELLSHFWLLRHHDDVIGSIGLQPLGEVGLLRSLAVHRSQRGHGHGSRLLTWLEDAACDLGIDTLYLLTTTAEAYFAARGYRPVSRQHAPLPLQQTTEFQALCPDTAVCMAKVLAP